MKSPTEIRRLLEIGLEPDHLQCSRCGTPVNLLGRATDGTLHPGRACNNTATLGTGEHVETNAGLRQVAPVTLKDVLADITKRYAPHLAKEAGR